MPNKTIPPDQAIDTGFLVFGLQRVGTNYLQELMRKNFVECWDRAVWKHTLTVRPWEDIKKKIVEPAIFVLYKNPYKWIESIALRGGVDYDKTQRTYPAKVKQKDDIMLNHYSIRNLARTYRDHYYNWVTTAPKYITDRRKIVRYEDLLVEYDRSLILDEIARQFGFERKYNRWKNVGSVPMSKGFNENTRKYYLNDRGFKELKNEHLSVINDVLSDEMMDELHYLKIDSV